MRRTSKEGKPHWKPPEGTFSIKKQQLSDLFCQLVKTDDAPGPREGCGWFELDQQAQDVGGYGGKQLFTGRY